MPSPFVWILAVIIIIFTVLMIIAYMTPWYGVSTSVSTSCTKDGNYATDQVKGSDCCSRNGVTAAYAGSLLTCNPARSTSS